MGNILNFKSKFELELSKEMRLNGFSEEEISIALQFIKDNPLNNDDDPIPPSKKMKPAEVIPMPFKTTMTYRKAA